jgi:hypothetical protein
MRSSNVSAPIRVVAIAAAIATASLAGCASGSLASEGAAQGAKSGAIGGAVAGAVASIFWGGNVVENMVAGAAVSAAAGAAMGGAAGASADKEIEQKRNMSEEQAALLQKIGPDNFDAARELGLCKHKTAIGKARTAYGRAQDNDHKRYALMIEAIANEEVGLSADAEKVYPLLVSTYGEGATVDQVKADVQKGLQRVQQARQTHGLNPTCG